jgi:hypothetical protein
MILNPNTESDSGTCSFIYIHTHIHTQVNVIYFVKFGAKLCNSVTIVTRIVARRFPSAHRSLVPSCCLLAVWRTVTDIVDEVNELWTATVVLTPHLLRLHMKYCVLQRLFAVSTVRHGVTCIIMCGWKWVDCSPVRLGEQIGNAWWGINNQESGWPSVGGIYRKAGDSRITDGCFPAPSRLHETLLLCVLQFCFKRWLVHAEPVTSPLLLLLSYDF